MPTGYTAFIEDGTITTGKEFLKLCSRAFGIAIELRDEPLTIPTPTKFEPRDYYFNKYKKEVNDLNEALALTPELAKSKMTDEYMKRKESASSCLSKILVANEQYERIRNQVESWNPPTDDHNGIKEFALKQIDMSIEPQSLIDELRQTINQDLDVSEEAINMYISERIKSCEDSVRRAKESLEEELVNVEKKNRFMQQFLDSLEEI